MIGNFKGTIITRTIIGTTVKSVARPIHSIYVGVENIARPIVKAYVGVGGKARPFWSYTASFYGNLDNLPGYISDAQGVTFNNNAIFFGGFSVPSESTNVGTKQTNIYAYNSSLTRSIVGTISSDASYSRDVAATDKYIISATSVTTGSKYFNIINTDFTTTTVTHPSNKAHSEVGVGSLGNYLFAAGGVRHMSSTSRYISQDVSCWDENLTARTTIADLQYQTKFPNLSNNDTYIFIGGGSNNFATEDNDSPYVTAYDTALSQYSAPSLHRARYAMGTTTFNNLAIFAGGESLELKDESEDEYYTAMSQEIDTYTNTLTHKWYTMQYARGFCAPVGLDHNMIIRGGHSYFYADTIGKTAEIIDRNFTSTILSNISPRSLIN
jgi:hypothetical protein